MDPEMYSAEYYEDDELASWRIQCTCGTVMMYTNHNEFTCMECGNHAYFKDDGDLYYEHNPEDDYEEYYGEEDDIPEGCRSCGGDYPNCVDGCNLMND